MRKRNSKVLNLQLPASRKGGSDTGIGPTDMPTTNPLPSITVVLPSGLNGGSATEAMKAGGITTAMAETVRRSSLTAVVNNGWVTASAEDVDQSLEQDVSVTMREAAIKGYSMDAVTNVNLVAPGPLKDFWSWMIRADKISQRDGARIGKFDFSYQGVLPVLLGNGGKQDSVSLLSNICLYQGVCSNSLPLLVLPSLKTINAFRNTTHNVATSSLIIGPYYTVFETTGRNSYCPYIEACTTKAWTKALWVGTVKIKPQEDCGEVSTPKDAWTQE